MSETPHLGLPYLAAAQAQKHVTVNEGLQRLDSIVQLSVIDRDLSAPPGAPAEGARYIVAAGSTGAWAGHDNEIAVWQDSAWMFLVPKEGWLAWVADEDKLVAWTTVAWAEVVGSGGGGGAATFLDLTDTPDAYSGQGLRFVRVTAGESALEFASPPATEQTARLGVNIAPSSTDRLSVASAFSRFTHTGTGGHQLKIDKAAAGDSASVIFQRADSGRAEFGLVASDTFQLKVSANGSAWVVGMSFDHNTGDVSFGGGGRFSGGLGVGGASPDASNRLAVNGAASLLSHAGTSHQLKINKAGASDSASVVFQKGFSGRAEFGLVASDRFQLKVSPDGAAWTTALEFDHATGAAKWSANETGGGVLPIQELYNSGVLRVRTRWNGITEWYLNSGSGEVGKIAYSTPSGRPGIVLADVVGDAQSIIYFQNYDRLTFQFRLPSQVDAFAFLGTGEMQINGSTVMTSSRHPQLRSYVKTALPSASPAGQLIYVSDDVAGATVAFSDGSNWRRVHDRAVVA